MPYKDPKKHRECMRRSYMAHREERIRRSIEWAKNNPNSFKEKQRRYRAKNPHVKRLYGIEPEEYNRLIEEAGTHCRICNREFGSAMGEKPCLDHDHNTGSIRGIICGKCNLAEGLLGSPEAILNLYNHVQTYVST